METVVLAIHLVIALCLIGVVLVQRSEGGGLGIGGGGGGMTAGRSQATAMSKLTWGFAVAFIATSLTLTILATQDVSGRSIFDTTLPSSGDGAELIPDASLLPALDLPGGAAVPPADSGGLVPPADIGPGSSGPAAPPPAD